MNLDAPIQAIEVLERAVSLDPHFANAWASLVLSYTGVWDGLSPLPLEPAELHRRSSAALGHALELAPNSPATLLAAGAVAMQEHNWREAERRCRQLLQQSPADYDANVGYAAFLIDVGRPKESYVYWQRAKVAEPLLRQPSAMLVQAYDLALETDRAISESAHARTLSGDPTILNASVFLRDLAQRDRKAVRKWLEGDDSTLGRGLREGLTNPAVALTALRKEYADPANQGRSFPMGIVAHWASFFGDEQLSLQALKSFGPSQNIFIIWRPDLTRVRQLPGFKDLVRDLGLVDFWRTSGNWGDFCKPVGADDFECH
jgi:tetratricopeptide (TPR) repeat protein